MHSPTHSPSLWQRMRSPAELVNVGEWEFSMLTPKGGSVVIFAMSQKANPNY